MLRHIKTAIIILLIGTNLTTLYCYYRKKNSIRNGFMPTFKEDYLTRQLNLTELTKEYEKKFGAYPGFAVENRPGKTLVENYNFDYVVPLVLQNPDYPNGCEAASATMLLSFHNVDISLKEFIDDYLIKKPVFERDGKRYGPDPSSAFAGDPADALYGWGALEPAIKQAIIKVIDDKMESPYYTVIGNDNKMSLPLFAQTYQKPFIIWTTIDYSPLKEVYQWYSYDGNSTYTYSKNSHTVIVTGMDDDNYYINDPLKKETRIAIEKEKLEESFDSTGRQAIAIDVNIFEEETI